MSVDQSVKVQPDSTGKAIDTSEITRSDGTLVERQRVVVSDPDDPNAHAVVNGEAGRGAAQVTSRDILEELRGIRCALDELKVLIKTIATQ